jgi:hypothetical protein
VASTGAGALVVTTNSLIAFGLLHIIYRTMQIALGLLLLLYKLYLCVLLVHNLLNNLSSE